MATNIVIPSVLNSSKVAYRLSSEWPWDKRGNAPLSLYITQYETYGDGTVQHSGEWCAQWEALTDVCLSITRAICADPKNKAWQQLAYVFHSISDETLAFVQTIKYREDKWQWFNMAERKVSASESKQHDRRWERVEPWMDGKASACLSILLNANNGVDWLGKLYIADDLRQSMGFPLWEEMFKPVTELTGDWHQAFRAFRMASEAISKLDYAQRASESAEGNSKRATEQAAA